MIENNKKKYYSQQGFALIDVLIAIVIIATMIPVIISYVQMGNEMVGQKLVAGQTKIIADGCNKYIQDNYTALEASSSATNSTHITVADLITGNYLPASTSSKNAWDQTYDLYVLNPATGQLKAILLTSGGKSYSAAHPRFGAVIVPKTAAIIGAQGGFVPPGIIASQPNTVLQGAGGGWTFTFAGTNIPNPGAGHIGMLLFYNNGVSTGDYLYRNKVPGQPELNQMSTDIDMTGNDIRMGDGNIGVDTDGTSKVGSGVGLIDFEDHAKADFACGTAGQEGSLFFVKSDGLYLCRNGVLSLIIDDQNTTGLRTTTIASNGDTIDKPTCPATAPNPKIFLALSMISEDDKYYPIKAAQTWATDNGASWTVHLRIMTNDGGWMNPDATHGKISVTTRCSL